jgi:hypothetical protein
MNDTFEENIHAVFQDTTIAFLWSDKGKPRKGKLADNQCHCRNSSLVDAE